MAASVIKHRFTVREYDRMGEAGVFEPGTRVELIDGEILAMTPIGVPHAAVVTRLQREFSRLGERVVVRVQQPVMIGDYDEPEPDIVVAEGRDDCYGTHHPGPEEVLLVAEVAHTTVRFDRETKGPLYARAGIREYWLVNLEADVIEVYREPGPDGYGSRRDAGRGEWLHLLAFPDFEVAPDDILG
jgi:Uma2 family endonuclease